MTLEDRVCAKKYLIYLASRQGMETEQLPCPQRFKFLILFCFPISYYKHPNLVLYWNSISKTTFLKGE